LSVGSVHLVLIRLFATEIISFNFFHIVLG
jgi:hypothetical protein